MRRLPFLISRIAILAGAAALLLAIPLQWLESHSFCLIYHVFDIRCITCGMTRAFANALRLQFLQALAYNPLISLLFPLYLLFLGNDLYTLCTLRKRAGRKSLSERLWLLIFPGSLRF